ncbi:hypothetical protein N665_0076s0194 [Sinapis alba]|nr:hypothetical protein N665_0076s0194 [Sinapis alba]
MSTGVLVSSVMLLNDRRNSKRNNLEEEEEDAHQISIDQDAENMVEKDVPKSQENDDDDDDEDEVEKSAEPTTPTNMVLKKLLRGARYFDPPGAGGWESCYSCGEQGHVTINCPTPTTRKKPCFICGSFEHGAKQCTKGHDCYICKKGGHRAKDCPDKYKSGSKSARCLRCGHSGHDMILCNYDYSRDDLKDIQCYVCKRFGHLCCVEPGNNSLSWSVSCYRCGQLGHIGLACGRNYEESTDKDSASSCFRCGEEGHFSRECPNSSSIRTSHVRDSPSLCYRCNGAGHFARECPSSPQVSKRHREASTPSHKSHKKIKETPEYNSTPHESNRKKTKKKKSKENLEHYSTLHESNGKKKNKKKKTHKGEQPHSTPHKPKKRSGWITEEDSFQRGKMRRRPRSPIKPSSRNQHSSPTITYMGGYSYRSPTFHSGGNFPTTPYGRNSSFESSGYHQHNHRYAPAPSRYASAHHHHEFQWNYGR